jgi:hypothetical protein
MVCFCKFRRHGDHQVRLCEGLLRRVALQARAQGGRIGIRDHALAGGGGHGAGAGLVEEGASLFRAIDAAASEDHHRPLGRIDQLGRRVDVGRLRLRPKHTCALRLADGRRRTQHVEREVEDGRSRPCTFEQSERLRHRLGQLRRFADRAGEAGERCDGGMLVRDLVQPAASLAEVCAVVDAGQDQHRHRIRIGLADRRRGVHQSRAGDQAAHGRPAEARA